jgi:Homeodomain-like domain
MARKASKPSKEAVKKAADRAESTTTIAAEVPAERDPRGRKTEFKPEYCEEAAQMARDGMTDTEIAAQLGVHDATFYRWRSKYPLFREALQLAKEACDRRVERSLYARAIGYSYDAVKVVSTKDGIELAQYREHVPPDVGAAKLWLTNRRPKEWRDTGRGEVNTNIEINGGATSAVGPLAWRSRRTWHELEIATALSAQGPARQLM